MDMTAADWKNGAEPLDQEDIGRMLQQSFGGPDSAFLSALTQVRDSMRDLTSEVRETRSDVRAVSDRVIRLEERDKRLDAIEAKADKSATRLAELENERNRRDGAQGAVEWSLKWGPTLFGLFTAVYLLARALGVLHLPSDEPRTTIPEARVVIRGQAAPVAEPVK